MLRVLIGESGSGKTYYIQEELLRGHMDYFGITNYKNVCAIERKEYNEYSHVFHPDFVTVYKPDDCMVDSLLDASNMNIIIDCENYSEEFLKKVFTMARRARVNNNTITVTFQPRYEVINCENQILKNADEVLVGECGGSAKALVEEVFKTKLVPTVRKFNFQKVV